MPSACPSQLLSTWPTCSFPFSVWAGSLLLVPCYLSLSCMFSSFLLHLLVFSEAPSVTEVGPVSKETLFTPHMSQKRSSVWSLLQPSMGSLPPVSYFGLHLTEKSEAGETALWAPKHPASASKMAPSDWMLYLSIKRSSSSAGGLLARWAGPGGHSAVSNVLQTMFTQTEVNTECPFSSQQPHTEDEPDDSRWCLIMASMFLLQKGRVVWHVFTRYTTGIYLSGAIKVQVLETYILILPILLLFG